MNQTCSPLPCNLIRLSCVAAILNEHAELATSVMSPPAHTISFVGNQAELTAFQQLYSPVTDVIMCPGFQHLSNYAKWRFLDMKRILNITGSSFAHIYLNPYTSKSREKGVQRLFFYSGGNLFCQVSVGPVLLCYVTPVLSFGPAHL